MKPSYGRSHSSCSGDEESKEDEDSLLADIGEGGDGGQSGTRSTLNSSSESLLLLFPSTIFDCSHSCGVEVRMGGRSGNALSEALVRLKGGR